MSVAWFHHSISGRNFHFTVKIVMNEIGRSYNTSFSEIPIYFVGIYSLCVKCFINIDKLSADRFLFFP